jgi:hypothetical protein
MKDEAYVKEILQKFGETIDFYAKELKTKKYARMYGMLTDYNKNDPGVKNAVIQMQNVHSCFTSDEIAKMSAGCISESTHTHIAHMPPPYKVVNEMRVGLSKTGKGAVGVTEIL